MENLTRRMSYWDQCDYESAWRLDEGGVVAAPCDGGSVAVVGDFGHLARPHCSRYRRTWWSAFSWLLARWSWVFEREWSQPLKSCVAWIRQREKETLEHCSEPSTIQVVSSGVSRCCEAEREKAGSIAFVCLCVMAWVKDLFPVSTCTKLVVRQQNGKMKSVGGGH